MAQHRKIYCIFGCDALFSFLIPIHRFPNPQKHPILFAAWVEAIGDERLREIHPIKVYSSKRARDHHFESVFKISTNRLSPSTIPTVNLNPLTEFGAGYFIAQLTLLLNMAKPVDIELRNAFTDLQRKMIETREKIKYIDLQIETLRRVMHHVDVTQREIDTFPPGTKTYESVGRMFLMTTLDGVKQNLKYRENLVVDRTTELTTTKQYLEKSLKESEDNLREMVQQRKEQSDTKP